MNRRILVFGISAAWLTVSTATAQSRNDVGIRPSGSQHTWVYHTSLGAGGDAFDFSDQLNSIGVVLYFAEGIVDPIPYGDQFVSELLRRGVRARAFAAPVGGRGLTVLYQVGVSGFGPIGAQEAASRMSEAVRISQARDRVLSPGYVPSQPRP